MKKIVLTGGGTAGHVNPNIALLPGLCESGFEVSYIGSKNGIEKELISKTGIPYFSISTGKLRRYFSPQNITDIFRVLKGISESRKILKKLSPDIIFSKGGFVSVPVVLAASRLHIPIIIHESDSTPGLANRISFKFSKKICASFPETMSLLPKNKAVLTGSPIRNSLLSGDKETGLNFCGFSGNKPVITIMGGSIGAVAINNAIRESLSEILEKFDIVHLCGKGNIDHSLADTKGYAQFEYVNEELNDIFAATDLMISRAGANAIFEILYLKIPNILIPLPTSGSRGDQLLNAKSFEKSGYSAVLLQDEITKTTLINKIETVMESKDTYIRAMEKSNQNNAVQSIIDLIVISSRILENSSSVKVS